MSSQQRRIVTCADCGETRINGGRNLCEACYTRHRYHGTLDQFPCSNRPAAELVEDFDFLRREGLTRAEAAERMGIAKKRLEKALERHSRQDVA